MADNYSEATVSPCIPAEAVTPRDLAQLARCGLEWEGEEELYFFAPNGIWESEDGMHDGDDAADDERDAYMVFQEVLARLPDTVEAIEIEGALSCSKMRPGEFGGFCVYITRDQIRFGGTGQLLREFAQQARAARSAGA